jgi:sulfhydrogenase subunit alpha
MARYNLNYDKLSPLAREAAHDAGLGPTCLNPFKSIIIRSIEVLYAFDEALRIIEQYEAPERPAIEVHLRAGTGYACTEAPRGTLYHRFQIDDEGRILNAKIVPPTSQNQKSIENDLRYFATQVINLPEEQFLQQCEQAIRNYDPCISCATHFLRLHIDRA